MNLLLRFNLIVFIILGTTNTTYAYDPDNDVYNGLQWNYWNNYFGTGQVSKAPWFEWWYYKVIDPTTNDAYLFTYGVVNPWDTQKKTTTSPSKAFVTFGSLSPIQRIEEQFPVEAFKAEYNTTNVQIGGNIATHKMLQGNIKDSEGNTASWDLTLEPVWRFNAMGWGMFTDWISGIYWYPAQASAKMSGWINYKGRHIKLENAPAYQDRNWGRLFPRWWAWIVSNDFENSPGTVLAAGGGRPLVLDSRDFMDGMCIGLIHQGQEYKFRTTDGDDVKIDIQMGHWSLDASNSSGQRIEINAFAPPEKFILLPFLTPQGETFYDYEALLGNVDITLSEDDEIIAILHSKRAGIEFGSPKKEDVANFFKQKFLIK